MVILDILVHLLWKLMTSLSVIMNQKDMEEECLDYEIRNREVT